MIRVLSFLKANARLAKRGGRTMAITPRHYLDFINHYANLFNEKRSELEEQQMHLNVGLRKIKETVDQVRIFKTLLFVKVGVIKRISVFNLNSPIWQSNSGGRVATWPKNKESGTGSEECSSQWQVEKDGERSARGWEEKGKNHHYLSRA